MQKNNYIKSNYLLSYDSINKYNLSSTYKTPEILNIVLEFPLKNIIKAFENKVSEEDSLIQIKAFLFFYFCFNNIPFINSNKLKDYTLDNPKFCKETYFNAVNRKITSDYYICE